MESNSDYGDIGEECQRKVLAVKEKLIHKIRRKYQNVNKKFSGNSSNKLETNKIWVSYFTYKML